MTWLRLLRGGGRAARLETVVSLVATALITLLLVLVLGIQGGLAARAERTALRTPEPAAAATAVQAGYTDYVGNDPIAVIELAALDDARPDVPGMADFPEPGEVWVSAALAQLMSRLPSAELAGRYPAAPSRLLDGGLLEHPDELVAVVGRDRADPVMRADRPPHQWNEVTSVAPTGIDRWSVAADFHQGTYRDLVLIAALLLALPLVVLGGLAARLLAARRQRRLATLRLVGATSTQTLRMVAAEVASVSAVGAVVGAAVAASLLPGLSRVPIKGGAWFVEDLRIGAAGSAAVVLAVVVLVTAGALIGLRPVLRDPLGVYRRSRPQPTRLWGLLLVAVVLAVYWTRSTNAGVSVVFTGLAVAGAVVVATGPLLVAGVGRIVVAVARGPATLLAGRHLLDDPRGAWRSASGLALAACIAGFVAVALPAGLALTEEAAGDDQLRVVVPAADLAAAERVDADLEAAGIDTGSTRVAAPQWLEETDWGTLAYDGADQPERDAIRTVLARELPGRPAVARSDDELPNTWLVQDAAVVGSLVGGVAVVVALASMLVGSIGRIVDNRSSLTSLRLAGTPMQVLLAAQRRERLVPTVVLAGAATTAGVTSGSAVGPVQLLAPPTAVILAGLVACTALALLVADRATRSVLDHATADLSERER